LYFHQGEEGRGQEIVVIDLEGMGVVIEQLGIALGLGMMDETDQKCK
jgi:hypothetical protein